MTRTREESREYLRDKVLLAFDEAARNIFGEDVIGVHDSDLPLVLNMINQQFDILQKRHTNPKERS